MPPQPQARQPLYEMAGDVGVALERGRTRSEVERPAAEVSARCDT
jgi:hypothetical protein